MDFYIPWWGKILSIFISTPSRAIFSESEITLKEERNTVSASLMTTPRRPKIEKTWLGYRVNLSDSIGSFYLFDVAQVEQFQEKTTKAVESKHRLTYQALYEDCHTTAKAISSLIAKQRFVRRSEFTSFLEELTFPTFFDLTYPELMEESELKLIDKIKSLPKDKRRLLDLINDKYINDELNKHQALLGSLNDSQKRAVIVDDDTNIVLAGAGSGKTKTMVTRAKYLVETGKYAPKEILMLAYGRDAKKEMEERLGSMVSAPVDVMTFHGFGKAILEKHSNEKKIPDDLATDEKKLLRFVEDELQRLLKGSPEYFKLATDYFQQYFFPYRNPFDFESKGEYYQYLKANEIRALNTNSVKSFEEVLIANFLYINQVNFVYEPKYTNNIEQVGFTSYRPDFYLCDYDIYIEHFGVNEKLEAPAYMNPVKYRQDIFKKRRLLRDINKTELIETYSFEQGKGVLLSELRRKLERAGVVLTPMSPDRYFEQLEKFGAISKLGKLLHSAMSTSRTMGHDKTDIPKLVKNEADRPSVQALIDLYTPIEAAYEALLEDNETIDFDSMINEAARIVEEYGHFLPYKTILVDEYQDISPPRARLLKALMNDGKKPNLFVVGDDWQGIYRFSGADLSYTYQFFQKFGDGTRVDLDETYRFNDSISQIATKFVTANTAQITKSIKAREVDEPRVHLVRTTANEQQAQIQAVIEWLSKNASDGSILLLNRYRFKKPGYLKSVQSFARNLGFSLTFQSVHGSKGREADYVILMDVCSGKNGFPVEKLDHPFIDLMLPERDKYPFAEERRLFYVALTRAREHSFVLSLEESQSSFVKDLIKFGEKIRADTISPSEMASKVNTESCPECKTGLLIERNGRYGKFQACTNSPFCEYTYNNCRRCQHVRKQVGEYHVCQSKTCGFKSPICSVCGRDMEIRNGPHGKFWGCTGFSSSVCRNTEQLKRYNDVFS